MGNKHAVQTPCNKPINVKYEFYIIAVIFNPSNYKSRIKLFQEFKDRMDRQNIRLTIVECIYIDQQFIFTKPNDPFHIQLTANSILWSKENLINIGIAHLPSSWKYVAWIDADVEFKNKNWLLDTITALKKYEVVQMFTTCDMLGKDGKTVVEHHNSFFYTYKQYLKEESAPLDPYATKAPFNFSNGFGHPGFAWAANRRFINKCLLLDFCIIGSADTLMAYSLIGMLNKTSIPYKPLEEYAKALGTWQENALLYGKKSVHYVEGKLIHFWHGTRQARNYFNRNSILTDNMFSPFKDLKYDSQKMIQYSKPNTQLEKDIKAYFNNRSEDE